MLNPTQLNNQVEEMGVSQKGERLYAVFEPDGKKQHADTLFMSCSCNDTPFCPHLWAAFRYEAAVNQQACLLLAVGQNRGGISRAIGTTGYILQWEPADPKAAKTILARARDIALRKTNADLFG